MKIHSFEWDERNDEHATRHGVSIEEIEEVIVDAAVIWKGKSGVYLAYGQTMDGRYALAVFQHKGQGVVRPITARPLTQKEKKMLRRWMR